MMKNLYCVMILLSLSGCASIVNGQNQSISVDSYPQGAECSLTNDKGVWYVTTPGSVTVHRAYGDMVLSCRKGKRWGSKTFSSSTKGMAYGNILFGGVIGGGVDAGTGAAYDYPQYVKCILDNRPQG